MAIHWIYIAAGLLLLVWSADRFVDGAAATARHLGVPPLLIGMLVVGFGTSAPEMLVSAISASKGNPGIALGNAYGSNICNLGLILGITALIKPIRVQSATLKKELPVLAVVTVLAGFQLLNGAITRLEAGVLLAVFAGLLCWSILIQVSHRDDPLGTDMDQQIQASQSPLKKSLFSLVIGLAVLLFSSRLLVLGAVALAQKYGVSDLLIGLTIVAIGTSLPELASSVMAARRNEHDIALGNVIGSNLFNTLTVVGIAGLIHPMAVEPLVVVRDLPVMAGLTLSIFMVGYGFRGRPGRINRFEGSFLLLVYLCYTGYLIASSPIDI